MNTIVNKLLDVDKEARQMLDEAQQYYDRTLLEIEEEKKRLLETYAQKGRRHVEELEAELSTEVDEEVARVRRETTGRRDAMEARYNECHTQWEDELFRRTLARTDGDSR